MAGGGTALERILAVGDAYLRLHRDHLLAFRLIGLRDVDPHDAAVFMWASWNGAIALRARGTLHQRGLGSVLAVGREMVTAGLRKKGG